MEDKLTSYYEVNDGWFIYYVNKETGEKKFKLEEGDQLVSRDWDDKLLSSIKA